MKPAVALLGLVLLLDTSFAADESCAGHCGAFHPQRKCQCDSLCVYYGSCCSDFDTACPKKIARGDTFEEPTELTTTEQTRVNEITTTLAPTSNPVTITTATLPPMTSQDPSPPVDRKAQPCSGHPFDAFLQLKNGSIYAFRGEYFFELDDKAVLPGYPKLIQDVWGIPGPIDAAFTRINCQGKSYIFKGTEYWRFDGDVMDKDYPKNISDGFSNIPDNVDAAFAIPAPGHLCKEKAYFFKGDNYYQYEFRHQPSHEECVQMSRSSPSVLFSSYTDVFSDQTWESLLADLFRGSINSHYAGPRLISRDWLGIEPPVDATVVGRVYLSPTPTQRPPQAKRRSSRKRRPGKRRTLHPFDNFWSFADIFDYSDSSDFSDYSDKIVEHTTQDYRIIPVQNVYFFKRDKYYRVDLQTKHVDFVSPRYPRSIAKYWIGCKHEETPDESRAEKR
ncbi:vitronectin b [Aulostomus maculatus]